MFIIQQALHRILDHATGGQSSLVMACVYYASVWKVVTLDRQSNLFQPSSRPGTVVDVKSPQRRRGGGNGHEGEPWSNASPGEKIIYLMATRPLAL